MRSVRTDNKNNRELAARSRALRYRVLWATLIAVLILTLHFFRPVQGGLWFQVFFDSLHVPVFGMIAVAVFMITGTRKTWRLRQRLLVTAVSVFVISILSEAAQIPGPRDASFEDLVADWLGATGFVLLALALHARRHNGRSASRVYALAGSAVLLVALSDLALTSAAFLERNARVPILVTFDSYLGQRFVRTQNAVLERVSDGTGNNRRAKIRLGNGAWPGVIFHDIWPNWSSYSTLLFELEAIGDEPLEINIRVHDQAHKSGSQPHSDRFNSRLKLQPAPLTFRIPLDTVVNAPRTRKMDLTRIDGIIIFGSRDAQGGQFWLSEIRLE